MMITENISRRRTIAKWKGRCLVGRALYYDRPWKVYDPCFGWVTEIYRRGCADKCLKSQKDYPLGLMHPWQPDAESSLPKVPIGTVRFYSKRDGLYYVAKIANSKENNRYLELVHDGGMRSVSIGFHHHGEPVNGTIIFDEIELFELSLLPTGFNALEGADVQKVR